MNRAPAWWPLDGEPIGPERVDELFAFLQRAAPRAVEAARAHLAARYPGTEPSVYALPRDQLAGLVLDPTMTGISVGSVSVRRPDEGIEVVSIMLMRSGHMGIGYRDEARRAVTVVVG